MSSATSTPARSSAAASGSQSWPSGATTSTSSAARPLRNSLQTSAATAVASPSAPDASTSRTAPSAAGGGSLRAENAPRASATTLGGAP